MLVMKDIALSCLWLRPMESNHWNSHFLQKDNVHYRWILANIQVSRKLKSNIGFTKHRIQSKECHTQFPSTDVYQISERTTLCKVQHYFVDFFFQRIIAVTMFLDNVSVSKSRNYNFIYYKDVNQVYLKSYGNIVQRFAHVAQKDYFLP